MSSCILTACDVTYCDSYIIMQFLLTKQYDYVSKAIKNQYHHIYQYFYSNLSSLEEYKLRKPGFTKQKMSLQTKKGMRYYQCSWLNFEWGNFLYNSGLNEGMLWNENYEAHNKLPKKNFYNSIIENDTFSGV